jgi:hypothetical protein
MAQNKRDRVQISYMFPFEYICAKEVQQVRNFFDILKVVLFRTRPVPAQATLLIKDLGDSAFRESRRRCVFLNARTDLKAKR